MPEHVGQNDTNFTLLQEELNAPIFRPLQPNFAIGPLYWWSGPAVEHWSLADVLSLSCARLVADG